MAASMLAEATLQDAVGQGPCRRTGEHPPDGRDFVPSGPPGPSAILMSVAVDSTVLAILGAAD